MLTAINLDEFAGTGLANVHAAANWFELLSGLLSRGLTVSPKLAIGDGAMGFRNALAKVFQIPGTNGV